MTTAISYDTVSKWFAKAHNAASSMGKADSAALWRDGLEHLENFRNQRNQAIELLRIVLDSDMAQMAQDEGRKSKILAKIRLFIKSIKE